MRFMKNKSKGLFDMDNMKNNEKTKKYQEQIKELFKEFGSDELYDTWAETFDVEVLDNKQVRVIYHGTDDIKKFKKKCQAVLILCIDSVMGEENKVKILKKVNFINLSPRAKKNITALKFFAIGMVFVCIAMAIIVIMCNYIGNRSFRETFYNVSSIKVDNNIRVIHISDIHKCLYGRNNKKLFARIEELEPDIIICTGDIVNSAKRHVEYATEFGEGLSKIAPSYYVYGNNEVETIYDFSLNQKAMDKEFGFNDNNRDGTKLLRVDDPYEKAIEKTGMKVLKNEKDTIKVGTMDIDVYGVLTSNPSSFWSYSEKQFFDYIYENPENLKITAVHEPFIFKEFQFDFWGDLMLCGHTHGGVIRIPVLGPFITKEGGLFPERGGDYVYGRYDVAGKPLIVSSGLENSNIFRINNEPELVVIDINKF